MKRLPLFDEVVSVERQHPIYRLLSSGDFGAEREVLLSWSEGFEDRDGKFCKEFQSSFESCLWELYVYAYLKEIGVSVDFSYSSPDFVVNGSDPFCLEATIASPADGRPRPYGYSLEDLPDDLNRFNAEATIRICNSFTSKVRRLRDYYTTLPQCKDKPFVLAIASIDRPFSHLAAMRPILSALYGLYHDEELTLALGAQKVISYTVDRVKKNETARIDLGYFCNAEYKDVSAVIFSNLATWGKVRALSDNPEALTFFHTFHPGHGLYPIQKTASKADYYEHLIDGLYVFHNPFAECKLGHHVLGHERLAQVFVNSEGELVTELPDDFLLVRSLMSINLTDNNQEADEG